MNIWIINHYALTPDQAGGTRHYDIARQLIAKGHKVTIIASSFHYALHKEMKTYPSDQEYLIEEIEGINFIWIKTTPYLTNGIKRVLNMLEFTRQLKVLKTLPLSKPDIIVGSSVHLFAVYGAYKLSKFFKVPFVMEVRDIWPQTLIDMGIPKFHPFIILLGFMERFLYQKADSIITLLPKASEHIESFGIPASKIFWVSNGVDTNPFINPQPSHLLNAEKFNLLYVGSIGMANNLELLIDAAKELIELNDLAITIVGTGPLKETLQKQAQDLKNITFLPPISKTDVPALLSEADLLYVALKDLPLYRFGMSMNKVFDYMASAKPILFASNVASNPVAISNSGIIIDPDDKDAIVNAVRRVYNATKETQKTMGDNGKAYVQEHFEISVIATQFETALIKAQENHA